jgi:hypothetical protein
LAVDSPLEGTGFEPAVPRPRSKTCASGSRHLLVPLGPDRKAPLSGNAAGDAGHGFGQLWEKWRVQSRLASLQPQTFCGWPMAILATAMPAARPVSVPAPQAVRDRDTLRCGVAVQLLVRGSYFDRGRALAVSLAARWAFDCWTPEEGLSRGYTYGRIEDAHYARKVEIRYSKRCDPDHTIACNIVDDFVRLTI